MLEPTVPVVAPAARPGYDPGHLGGEGDPLIALTALWNLTASRSPRCPPASDGAAACRSGCP